MGFSIFSNFGYNGMKLFGENSDTYKPIVENNLSLPLFKACIRGETLPLAMLYYICIRKNEEPRSWLG